MRTDTIPSVATLRRLIHNIKGFERSVSAPGRRLTFNARRLDMAIELIPSDESTQQLLVEVLAGMVRHALGSQLPTLYAGADLGVPGAEQGDYHRSSVSDQQHAEGSPQR
jgi:hypothetical protein